MNHFRAGRRRIALGLTLTELLVILLILGVLVFFGLPAVLQFSVQSRLAIVQSTLQRIAGQQAQWFVVHRSYGTLSQLGYPVDSGLAAIYLGKDSSISGHGSADSIYRVTVQLGSPSGTPAATPAASDDPGAAYYLIEAQPINDQAGDTRCGTLSLASTGQLGASGSQGEAGCWQK